jgi:hypothetical protein
VAEAAIWQGLASVTPKKNSNFMLSMRWYPQILYFNVYVYMAIWVGHTLKILLPPLLRAGGDLGHAMPSCLAHFPNRVGGDFGYAIPSCLAHFSNQVTY